MKKWILFFWLCVIALFLWNLYQIHQKSVTAIVPSSPLPNHQIVSSAIKRKLQVRLISYQMTDLLNRYEIKVKLKNVGNVSATNIKFFAQPYFRYQDDPLSLGKAPLPRDPRWVMIVGTQIDRLEAGQEATRTIDFEKFADLTPSGWSDECIPRITFDLPQ